MKNNATDRTYFRSVRTRGCIYWLIIGVIICPLFLLILPSALVEDPVTIGTLFGIYLYLIPTVWLLWKVRRNPRVIVDFFNRPHHTFTKRESMLWLAAILCTMALSIATGILVTLVFPGMKEWFFMKLFYNSFDTHFPLLNNLLMIASLLFIAPVLEELFFRGVFLQRWGHLWNVRCAIILSGIFFAIIHMEPVGSFLFGLIMCLLFLRTGSLVFPVIAHFLNNFVVFLILTPELSPDYQIEMTTAREDLIVCVVTLGIAIPLLIPTIKLLRQHWPERQTRL